MSFKHTDLSAFREAENRAYAKKVHDAGEREEVLLSDCCSAYVSVKGKTTNFYTCDKCGEACDVHKE